MTDNTSLISAVQSGNFEEVCRALETIKDINEPDEYGLIPLHVAVEDGNTKIVELLLKHKANIEIGGTCVGMGCIEYMYPIHIATVNDDLPMIDLLLKNGARIDTYDSRCTDKFSALHYAAYMNHVHLIEYFLEKGADVDLTNDEGDTPLMIATGTGQTEAVHFLISKNADVFKTDSTLNTLLHMAVQARNVETIKLFIEKGIEITKKNKYGATCLHLAAQRDDKDLIELLVKHGADMELTGSDACTPFHIAVIHGHLNIVEYFLENGVNIDLQEGETGYTALHLASKHKNIQFVKFFVNKGANINSKIYSIGYTPLHISAKNGYTEVTDFLIQSGANLDEKDSCDHTPLNLVFTEYLKHRETRYYDDFVEVAKVILKFMVLSRSCGDFFNDCVQDSFVQVLMEWTKNCESELEKMKTVSITNTNMSLYEVLEALSDNTKVVMLLRNPTVREELNNIKNYLETFPIYKNIMTFIERRIKYGEKKIQLIPI